VAGGPTRSRTHDEIRAWHDENCERGAISKGAAGIPGRARCSDPTGSRADSRRITGNPITQIRTDELQRAVSDLGLAGAMISGTTGGQVFAPALRRAPPITCSACAKPRPARPGGRLGRDRPAGGTAKMTRRWTCDSSSRGGTCPPGHAVRRAGHRFRQEHKAPGSPWPGSQSGRYGEQEEAVPARMWSRHVRMLVSPTRAGHRPRR
jgi:hypothetical protein